MRHITMSKRELEQSKVFDKILDGQITQREAAFHLKISIRWVRKKLKRYQRYGYEGLIHKNRGRSSPRKWKEAERELAIELLKTDWHGFGPTFAAEKLYQIKQIKISKETLRKIMIKERVWIPKKQKIKHRKLRERRESFGMFVQLDGSPHDWFEGRGKPCTLLVFIDDATSSILWLEFVPSEANISVMQATKNYLDCYGRPQEFYVDCGKVFRVNLNNQDGYKKTQWERAMKDLDIKVQHALSPQAKGRVERANETMQDRLVKEMRLANVKSIEEANVFLRETNFIAAHNNKFAVPAEKSGDMHRSTFGYNLNLIIALKEGRVVTNNYTIQFKNRVFQLHPKQPVIIRPKNIVIITTLLDGGINLSYKGKGLNFSEISVKPQKTIKQREVIADKKLNPVSLNSRRWASGLSPIYQMESRVKPAKPAAEAK